MNRHLRGLAFKERLPSDPGDFVLVFAGNGQKAVAAWTAGTPHDLVLGAATVRLTGRPVFLRGRSGPAFNLF